MSFFAYLPIVPADPIFGLMAAFKEDPRPNKVNLGIGIYMTEQLSVPLLSCVAQAEQELIARQEPKGYLPVEGDPLFLSEVAKLLIGEPIYHQKKECLTLMQTVGGSSALHLGGEVLVQRENKKIYIPNFSWPNHLGIFTQCGLLVEYYPYYDGEKKELDFEKFLEFLKNLPSSSAILLHVSCHNPSGADPTPSEWEQIAAVCQEKNHIPFLDAAYLGFDGTVEEDAFPIRYFIEREIELFAAISFSKNLALYAERIGCFMAFSRKESAPILSSQCKRLIRRNYSNPPKHGAAIIGHILTNSFLKQLWEEELLQMKQRLCEMRNNFTIALSTQGAKKNYSYLLNKKGLFSFCDLSKDQVETLIKKHAIYLTSDGRINLSGMTQESLSYVAGAIIAVGG